MQIDGEYIYYRAKNSTPNLIWDAELERFTREKKRVLAVFEQCMRLKKIAAFSPINGGFRLVLSNAIPVPNIDADGHGDGSVQELYHELSWVSENLDSLWPDSNNMVTTSESAVKLLTRMSYHELFQALDSIAHEKERCACKWIFRFSGMDHQLVLPPKATIRAYKDSYSRSDQSEETDRGSSKSGPRFGLTTPGTDGLFDPDQKQPGADDGREKEVDGARTDSSELQDKVKRTFRVVKILGPDEFLSNNNERVKVKRKDLRGRKVGDELLVYMLSSPNPIIDLTGHDVLKEWH